MCEAFAEDGVAVKGNRRGGVSKVPGTWGTRCQSHIRATRVIHAPFDLPSFTCTREVVSRGAGVWIEIDIESSGEDVRIRARGARGERPAPHSLPPERSFDALQSRRHLSVFDVADTRALEDEAIKAAVGEARKRAQMLADLTGVKVGKVLRVSTAGMQRNWNLSAKEISVSVDVSVDYEITD